jgi:hypothetical protein
MRKVKFIFKAKFTIMKREVAQWGRNVEVESNAMPIKP